MIKVPSNAKQVRASPECERWIEAQRLALNVLLSRQQNRLVKRKVPTAKKVPIAACVTDMKLKLDQATGELAEHNGFKARHASDYTRGPPLPKLRDLPNFAATADDLSVKMFLADARGIVTEISPRATWATRTSTPRAATPTSGT